MSLFSAPIIVLDTETTGFHQPWARVVDLAGVVVETDGSIRPEPFSCLIHPDILDDRATEALKISGLERDYIASNGIATVYAVGLWRKWVAAQDTPFLTSFNVGFDRPHIERMGLLEGRWCNCIMLAATEAMGREGATPMRGGKYQWVSLKKAAPFYGIEQVQPAHRALSDALTAARVMVEIRRQKVEGARISKGLFAGGGE